MAGVLHSFYTGIEKIFITIARSIDKTIPEGSMWHKDLLLQMTKGNEKRNTLIPASLRDTLSYYLLFRHFYRHAYSSYLEWEEIEMLWVKLDIVWEEVKSSIGKFLKIEL